MKYEVEQKFPTADMPTIEARLLSLGATISRPRLEIDQYYAHPSRDFAATDEALRIRKVGFSGCITYKGPKLDPVTKTRQEMELPLDPDQISGWARLLEVLGFRPVAEVRKQRRKAFVSWQQRRVEVSLDEVHMLGTFVELELVVDARDVEPAKACIASLAEELELADSQRRSYLELLLERL